MPTSWRPEQAHHCRHDECANEGGIDDHRDRHPDADGLDGHDAREREGEEDAGHDRRRTGDQAPAAFESVGDGRAVVAGANPRLLHSRKQEHLVVHGQPEDDAEEQHRDGRIEWAGREAEKAREMSLIEHPDERAEGGAQESAFMSTALNGSTSERSRMVSTMIVVISTKPIASGVWSIM